MAVKKAKVERAKAFDDFVMDLFRRGTINEMDAYNLTRFCSSPKQRELFYQKLIVSLATRKDLYWEKIPDDVKENISPEEIAKAIDDGFAGIFG